MDKIKKPNNLSELLGANLIKRKASEKVILPKVMENFDKQQLDRFEASSKNFNEWNANFRKELSELSTEIFDKWNESYHEIVMDGWRNNFSPANVAKTIYDIFENKSRLRIRN